MNPQGKGKIEWTDYTLSIVTGCKHGCQYGPRRKCYAHLIADGIYKEKFEPTFRPERIAPAEKKMNSLPDGKKIFLCDMADLFGAWVPKEWIEANIQFAVNHPNLIFQFLTKNPKRYSEFAFPENCWLGTTWDGMSPTLGNERILKDSDFPEGNIKFVSFEPLMARFDGGSLKGIDWIIVGELTGKALTREEISDIWRWAKELIDEAEYKHIPVFVKNQLGQTYKQREYPRER